MIHKLFILLTSAIAAAMIIGSITFYILIYRNESMIKQKVLNKNPNVTRIYSINTLGGWGERGKEYSLEVEIDGKKYRVWTSGDGTFTNPMLEN